MPEFLSISIGQPLLVSRCLHLATLSVAPVCTDFPIFRKQYEPAICANTRGFTAGDANLCHHDYQPTKGVGNIDVALVRGVAIRRMCSARQLCCACPIAERTRCQNHSATKDNVAAKRSCPRTGNRTANDSRHRIAKTKASAKRSSETT